MNSGSHNETDGTPGWDQWLAQHAPKLLLFARQQARCEADAGDLLQEAVLECWQRQADSRPPPLGLVFATIRRRAVDLVRREGRRVNREAVLQEDIAQPWFDSDVGDRERDFLIQQAMNILPVEQREVITLKVWGELTFAEIAIALDIPANTASSRYRYGLLELRRLTKEVFT